VITEVPQRVKGANLNKADACESTARIWRDEAGHRFVRSNSGVASRIWTSVLVVLAEGRYGCLVFRT
jgi:hypothetical protein